MSTFDYDNYPESRYYIDHALHCPKCGANDIQYQEEAIEIREVLGVTTEGKVLIDNENPSYDPGDGTVALFVCQSCGYNWEIAAEDYDFVVVNEYINLRDLDEPSDGMTDAEADADVLRSAGMGTDEDYGYYDK